MDTEDRTTGRTGPATPDSANGPAAPLKAQPVPTSDTIAARQNAAWSIQLLAAQRQLYSEAKVWCRLRAWSVTAMAAIGVGALLLDPELLKVLAS